MKITTTEFIALFFNDGLLDSRELPKRASWLTELHDGLKGELAHLLYLQTKHFNGEVLKTPKLWIRAAWEIEYTKWQSDKWLSEHRRQTAYLEDIEIRKIAVRMKLGDVELAYPLARTIYETENKAAATAIGVDTSDIKWREEIRKEVDALLPELKREGIF